MTDGDGCVDRIAEVGGFSFLSAPREALVLLSPVFAVSARKALQPLF